ncbi:hypothetical protein CLV44_10980 [Marinobacterium halophilum]|uniref:Protein-glutamine gamma-glutamyltransferase-like C-terminal domain-containing protein n=1 Tax=Marinobacterium halophilum TaxID=267374 RepID=A0A2P8EXF8_9GAMM|nr:DUF4129 domain-containing protein [Marinobacterium halophilum]PSL14144.1 hypothetical protein CLV44_10980 [Marinobacterium halophilum]
MNLADLQIRAQVRTPWQALDLGVLMARRWFRPLWLAWLLPAVLIFTVLSLGFADDPWVVTLVIWWLKPLFERLPLLLLSRYLFAERTLRGLTWWQLLRTWLFGSIGALLWRRFDPRRAFLQAVTVLEKQKGRARLKRCRTLAYGHGRAATWLTLILAHVEMLLVLAVPVLVLALVGDFFERGPGWWFSDESGLLAHLSNALTLICMSLVAPFYVASGFALYINRRIELEAWDLDLLFRQIVQDHQVTQAKPSAGASSLVTVMLVVMLWLTYLPASPVQAAVVAEVASPDATKKAAVELLSSPPYVIEEEVTQWRWKETEKTDDDSVDSAWLESLFDIQEVSRGGVSDGFYRLAEILMWLGGLMLLVLLARVLWRQLGQSEGQPDRDALEADAPRVLMGMAIGADSLPSDLNAAVMEALDQGDTRLALSLVYRQALHRLVHHYRVEVESWHTELECAAAARCHPDLAGSTLFDELTGVWLRLAYAHESPIRPRVEQLLREVQRELAGCT